MKKCLTHYGLVMQYGDIDLGQHWFMIQVMACCLMAPSHYRKTSNIRHTLVGNKIVDQSDVVGAAPVGAAPTTSSFSIHHLVSRKVLGFGAPYIRDLTVPELVLTSRW